MDAFLAAGGGQVHPRLQLTAAVPSGRGVVAAGRIAEGAVLIRLPRALCLSLSTPVRCHRTP